MIDFAGTFWAVPNLLFHNQLYGFYNNKLWCFSNFMAALAVVANGLVLVGGVIQPFCGVADVLNVAI